MILSWTVLPGSEQEFYRFLDQHYPHLAADIEKPGDLSGRNRSRPQAGDTGIQRAVRGLKVAEWKHPRHKAAHKQMYGTFSRLPRPCEWWRRPNWCRARPAFWPPGLPMTRLAQVMSRILQSTPKQAILLLESREGPPAHRHRCRPGPLRRIPPMCCALPGKSY